VWPDRKSGDSRVEQAFWPQTDYRNIVTDLKDVVVVDREVMRMFMSCEADVVKLERCIPYIRKWMERETD
jgi:hypothetical protein